MDYTALQQKLFELDPTTPQEDAAKLKAIAEGKDPSTVEVTKEVVTESKAEPMDELAQFAALAGVTPKSAGPVNSDVADLAALAGVSVSRKEVVTESAEVVAEKSVSKAQQKAAGAALAAKRGDIPKSDLEGASKEMMKMSTKDLEDFASTKHKGLPNKKKKTESFDKKSFRSNFEKMVESKFKKGEKVVVDGEETEITVPDGPGPLVGVKKDGKTDMVKVDKVKKETEEGKSPYKKGTEKYKKHMAAKHASMNESVKEGAFEQMPPEMKEKVIAMYAKLLGGDMKKAEMLLKKALSPEGQAAIKQKYNVGESINESFEKFIGNEKMSFEEMVAVVKESGGQQQIDPVDQTLWSWANRVAASKGEDEMFAAKIYESTGGRFELYDVLNEQK